MPYDLVINNGYVIDGTGRPGFRGSIGIRDDHIEEVSDDPLSGTEEIDARGRVVFPGFIDLHSNADLAVIRDPSVDFALSQGITTLVVGHNGYSVAPCHIDQEESLQWRLGQSDWKTFLASYYGEATEWEWGSVRKYLDYVDTVDVGCHVATLVGYGTLRSNVMGFRETPPVFDEEVDEVVSLLSLSLADGAYGLSIDQSMLTEEGYSLELQRLLERSSWSHPRLFIDWTPWGDETEAAVDRLREFSRSFELDVHGSTVPVSVGTGEYANSLPEGATADHHFYRTERTDLVSFLPNWVFNENEDRMIETLRDVDQRDRMAEDIQGDGFIGWSNVSVERDGSTGTEDSIAAIANDASKRPIDVVCELIDDADGSVPVTVDCHDRVDLRALIEEETVALASNSTTAEYGHRRSSEAFSRALFTDQYPPLDVTSRIRRMTSLPAEILGLETKGRIEPGFDADLVVCDYSIADSGGRINAGTEDDRTPLHVIVDGTFALRDRTLTDDRAGSTLRSDYELGRL